MPEKLRFFLIGIFIITSSLHAQYTNLDWKWHDVGAVRHIIVNYGNMSNVGVHLPLGIQGLNVEYPVGSGIGFGARFMWIGARRTKNISPVTTSNPGLGLEFFPSAEPWDSVWVVERGEKADIPYWPNYTPISDQDIVCRYSDYNLEGSYTKWSGEELHLYPHFVDVIQTSHAWGLPSYDWILFQYKIIPTKINLENIYIALSRTAGIHNNNNFITARDDCAEYVPEKNLIIIEDTIGEPEDDAAAGAVGHLMFAPENIDPNSIKWTYKTFFYEDQLTSGDTEVHQWMSSGLIDAPTCDLNLLMNSFGPVNIALGDTLHFMSAAIFGENRESMLENIERLERLIENEFKTPQAPPRPPLRFEIANHQVTLRWDPLPGEVNPETYTDSLRDDFLTEPQPFEGYRVYKSSKSAAGSWTLLTEFDIAGNDHFSNTGIQRHYTDVGLLNNLEYWYSVTAFSKPVVSTGFTSLESSINKSVVTVTPGTAVPQTVGKVAVVPNPYRGDINYSSYNPPWEKPGQGRYRWVEQDRRIQFVNIPSPCEINIYTLAGDLVQTLHHDNPEKGFADWNLVSKVGQTIASGIYLFSCKHKKNDKIQVGKFVVIK